MFTYLFAFVQIKILHMEMCVWINEGILSCPLRGFQQHMRMNTWESNDSPTLRTEIIHVSISTLMPQHLWFMYIYIYIYLWEVNTWSVLGSCFLRRWPLMDCNIWTSAVGDTFIFNRSSIILQYKPVYVA